MRKLCCITMILTIMVLASGAPAQVTNDSTTWEGSYEADFPPDYPPEDPDWLAHALAIVISSIGGGNLTMDSYDDNEVGMWRLIPDHEMDFSNGATVEFRARVNECEGPGAIKFQIIDIDRRVINFGLTEESFSVSGTKSYDMDTTDDFHVYRIAIGAGGDQVRMWFDANTVSPGTWDGAISLGTPDSMFFGDSTGVLDADWDLDYYRWTNVGSYAPVGYPPYCGDTAHPVVVGDFNYNCHVDIKDFQLLMTEWLMDNRP